MLLDTPRVRSRLDLLYAISRELSADLEIHQILEHVLAVTVASVGASQGSLFLFDEEEQVENFFIIDNFEMEERSQPTVEAIMERGLVGWVRKNRRGTLVEDTAVDERWYNGEEHPEIRQAGSAIAVPLQLPDQLIGILTITSPQPGFFEQSDVAMLSILADQAAFAIDNARLFKAEQKRRRLADTLISIARTINSTLNLNEVLNLILEQLDLLIDYDVSSILLYDEDNERLSISAVHGLKQAETVLGMTIPLQEQAPSQRAITGKEPVVVSDTAAEPYWIQTPPTQELRSWIGLPLIAQEQVIGLLTIGSCRPEAYTETNLADIAAFADHAAIAVANAQTVARLQNAETSYANLFEDSSDLIIITTYQGQILNLNRKACQMLQRSKDVLLGADITTIDAKLHAYLVEQTKRLREGKEAFIELDLTVAPVISLELIARQVHYTGKDCVQWVGRDISARKEAERMREDLVNMVVHDLRGPIGNLINAIELLAMLLGPSQEENPNLTRVLKMARHSGQEVRDLVDSMLDVSRLEQGRVPLQREAVNIETMIAAVQEQIMPRAVSKNMSITFNPLPDLPPVWIDGSMIRRVLINLLDNAVKYTPNGGQVALTTAVEEETLHFTVTDNGPGISPADQTRIFEKFSRGSNEEAAPPGVGLGLAFCSLAAQAHGGHITLESSGIPGQGSAFHLYLPLVLESA